MSTSIASYRPDSDFQYGFLVHLCVTKLNNGSIILAIDDSVEAASNAFAWDNVDIGFYAGLTLVKWGDETRWIIDHSTPNFGALVECHDIYLLVMLKDITFEEATSKLQAIPEGSIPFWKKLLSFATGSGCLGMWAFGCNWVDLPICVVLGGLGCALEKLSEKMLKGSPVLQKMLATGVITFSAGLIASAHGGQLFYFAGIVKASIAIMLPGYSMFSALLDGVATKHYTASGTRFFYGTFQCVLMCIACKISMLSLESVGVAGVLEMKNNNGLITPIKYVPLLGWILCVLVFSNAPLRKRPMICVSATIVALIAFTIMEFIPQVLPPYVGICIVAGAVGFWGKVFALYFQTDITVMLLPALYNLVPTPLVVVWGLEFFAGTDVLSVTLFTVILYNIIAFMSGLAAGLSMGDIAARVGGFVARKVRGGKKATSPV